MNKEILRKYVQFRSEVMYTPLAEDAEICEHSPKKFSTPIRNSFWRSSRRLFQNNRSFKVNKKNTDTKSKKSKIQSFISEFHTKIQSWSEVRYLYSHSIFSICNNWICVWSKELRSSLQRSTGECKTPNCVTPNRRIRRMLGRTPEKLYSPFAIETPPNLKWHKFPESIDDPLANFYGWSVSSFLHLIYRLN